MKRITPKTIKDFKVGDFYVVIPGNDEDINYDSEERKEFWFGKVIKIINYNEGGKKFSVVFGLLDGGREIEFISKKIKRTPKLFELKNVISCRPFGNDFSVGVVIDGPYNEDTKDVIKNFILKSKDKDMIQLGSGYDLFWMGGRRTGWGYYKLSQGEVSLLNKVAMLLNLEDKPKDAE